MNRIVLIGNGFDLAHGLPTRYEDFINWYWDERVRGFSSCLSKDSKDPLCLLENASDTWSMFSFSLPHYFDKYSGKELIDYFENHPSQFRLTKSLFFNNILASVETNGWVDIENEYYKLLTYAALENHSLSNIKELNGQLQYVEDLLVKYLIGVCSNGSTPFETIRSKIFAPINPQDISIEYSDRFRSYIELCMSQPVSNWEEKIDCYGLSKTSLISIEDYIRDSKIYHLDYPKLFMLPNRILLLNFNYTNTADAYVNDKVSSQVHIHGELSNPKGIIFGYGDEKDTKYFKLQELNENECLSKIKSIKYMESDNYRKVLSFIDSAPFQIYIMGHSCGNSDRTLLNTLFEHKNCFSIKPFYYINKDTGKDNYLDLVQNISRNFTDMKLMRDRVVNKTYCETIV